ncbi:MAG: hypothetical protein ACK5MY_13055 [Jhaorihella sp.]
MQLVPDSTLFTSCDTIVHIPLTLFRVTYACLVLWGGFDLLRTITVGSCVSIQGIYVRTLSDGRIVVRVGKDLFEGRPVKVAA